MAHERKNGLTVAEKDVLWARFKNGESFVAIARALDRRVSSIYSVVREHGGVAPAIRRRAQRTHACPVIRHQHSPRDGWLAPQYCTRAPSGGVFHHGPSRHER